MTLSQHLPQRDEEGMQGNSPDYTPTEPPDPEEKKEDEVDFSALGGVFGGDD